MMERVVGDRSDMARIGNDPVGVDHAEMNSDGAVRLAGDRSCIEHKSIDRAAIAALIPHSGDMVLLDRVVAWDAGGITCLTRSHLDSANPLRRAGRLAATCGIEYALQAAALHGALAGGGVAQPAGFLAALRDVALYADRLDDPAIGDLRVHARLERHENGGLIFALELRSQSNRLLLSGRAIIALPRVPRA
jgi:predicted hotdog family 3-hydroxylacyl-ACP dehydratase